MVSEKGLYCSGYATHRIYSFPVSKTHKSDLVCLSGCWAKQECWVCTVHCTDCVCTWYAIEECGNLVTALNKHEHKVFWKPDKARPVKQASSRVVWRWSLIVCCLSFFACKMMQWCRSCRMFMKDLWPHMSVRIFTPQRKIRFLFTKQMFQFFCTCRSSSDFAVASKVQTVFEERRYITAMLYSCARIVLHCLHLLHWILPPLKGLEIDIVLHCCSSVEDAQQHGVALLLQTLVSMLFLLHCQLARKHSRWAVNVMVWCEVIARIGAEANAYSLPECGRNTQPTSAYELVARFFLLMYIHPLHGSILTGVLSVAHINLFIH